MFDHSFQHGAPDVLEINVNAGRAAALQGAEVIALSAVIKSRIEADLTGQVGDLFVASGTTDHAAAGHTAHLSSDLPNSTRCGRDKQRLTLLRLADLLHADPGCHARHTERAQVIG